MRRGQPAVMALDRERPDLEVLLALDRFAPRAARHHVATVDSPSPDLRNAVVLLTSEIVSRAAEQRPDEWDVAVRLRVWMPAEMVRVEMTAPRHVLRVRRGLHPRHYDLMLLDCVADRWSIDYDREQTRFWFEIDRGRLAGPAATAIDGAVLA